MCILLRESPEVRGTGGPASCILATTCQAKNLDYVCQSLESQQTCLCKRVFQDYTSSLLPKLVKNSSLSGGNR